jgi:uncharacterized protein (TIGR00296 family)
MEFDLSIEEGTYIVRLARMTIEIKLKSGAAVGMSDAPEKLWRPYGVFVTLNKVENLGRRLRGCIGLPLPEKPLVKAVVSSAISAALDDPRFRPVSLNEMDSIVLEVSILTPPENIKVDEPEQYPGNIEVGKDGLIVSRGWSRGLLLPQVPVELGWDSEEFLTQCCLKARLPPDAWLTEGVEISKFQAIVFSETEPRGPVMRVEL